MLLTAANEPTPVKARSAERVDERRDATWSCRSTLTLSSGPGSRTDLFGLLDEPGTLTNAWLTSIYVADCKGMAGLLPGIARLAQPRDARAPCFLTPPYSTILGECQLFASDLGFVLHKGVMRSDWPVADLKIWESKIDSGLDSEKEN